MTAKFSRVDYVSRMKDTTYYMHKINANPFIQRDVDLFLFQHTESSKFYT